MTAFRIFPCDFSFLILMRLDIDLLLLWLLISWIHSASKLLSLYLLPSFQPSFLSVLFKSLFILSFWKLNDMKLKFVGYIPKCPWVFCLFISDLFLSVAQTGWFYYFVIRLTDSFIPAIMLLSPPTELFYFGYYIFQF